MLRFPVLNLPDELVYLLKSNLTSVELQNKIVLEKINQNYALVQLLEGLFQEYDTQKRLPQALKKISWSHFRDQFASIYVYHQVHGRFPKEINLEMVRDIQAFEDKISDFSLHSNSRAFLLGFYLKISQVILRQQLGDATITLVELPKEVIGLLSLSTAHSEKVDLLIILVWHLNQFLGIEILTKLIKSGTSYLEIFEGLKKEQQEIMVDNFLAYGCSINENEIFLNERV